MVDVMPSWHKKCVSHDLKRVIKTRKTRYSYTCCKLVSHWCGEGGFGNKQSTKPMEIKVTFVSLSILV